MTWVGRPSLLPFLSLLAAGCLLRAGPGAAPARMGGPPLDTTGPLAIHVVYPPIADTGTGWHAPGAIASRDSTFVFGSLGRGDAELTVNGVGVPVYLNGAWLAWLPLPDDSVATFLLEARAGAETDRLRFVAPIAQRFRPPSHTPWIDTTSLRPTGDLWVRPGEAVRLEVRASSGATVRAVLPDGNVLPFLPHAVAGDVPWGVRAFGADPPGAANQAVRFAASWLGPLGPDPGHVLAPGFPHAATDLAWVLIEAIEGADTARWRWPLRLGVVSQHPVPVAVVNDDTAGTGTTDNTLAGRPAPYGTYHWFFPNGTVAAVSGRWDSQVRLQLSQSGVAWVDARDVQPLRPGTLPPTGTTQPLRLRPGVSSVVLRVPLPGRIPFRVDETHRSVSLTLYGVAANADWIQYGGTDPFVPLIEFAAPREDETVITVHLAEPVWGYRTRWSGDDLLLEIRRPPAVDRGHPLRGRVIALDAGHPPGGSTGPTAVYEGDVVLAVARKTRRLLEDRGATVVMLRDDTNPVSLAARVLGAVSADAEILVSIHANALPDGVNPFVNSGTSVYYFHPRSAPLARAVDRALVRQLGYRDLGVGRGDLALARPTWMPAVLAEGLFMMVPEQEAVLASEEGQWRYARGLVQGIEAFLGERARASR